MRSSILVAGTTFLFSGTLLFGMVNLAIANYVPHMGGWSDPPGKLSLALDGTMLRIPYIISILFMIIGVTLLVTAILKEFSNKNFETHVKAGLDS
ncbi:hypothetical protein [Paenibacillus sp. Soil750]|uniref:hypothetical protein n=1 Tax=Paenibacillus sp. Soil750 TaxID=1736398 RepID=UPI0007023605|nr:hypothetical protein [Paenibacillus sp. Soil750]KRE55959.1 hypothetical protein ASL11_35090 [Paenibacillus sp. Soil750]